MVHRPTMIRDQDRVEIRLTREAEYRLPFTFIEALNEGTLFDRPAHVFRVAARQHRLFHVVNRTTENILGTGVVQLTSGGNKSPTQAEVGGLMVHPAARGFGIASLLVKVMMVYAIKESGRDAPDEQYLAHVVDGNGGPLHALLEAGFRPAGHVDIHRGDIDAVIDHMLKDGESAVRLQAFAFDRQAVGKLVLSLWTFVREQRGLITRSDEARDIRVTVDFSHVIPAATWTRRSSGSSSTVISKAYSGGFDSTFHTCVTRGLEPRVHRSSQELFVKRMDCRVKPGNDETVKRSECALNARTRPAHFRRKKSRLALT